MRVVVTGGSGFIGSHVVDKLRDRGVRVRVVDMVMPTFRDDIEYYQASLLDLDALCMAFNDVDAVFHLAAVADVGDVLENPQRAECINVRGTFNVLEASRWAGVERVVYGSTIWVYSESEQEEVDEETPLNHPSHFYTATKLVGETYCHAYSELYDIDTTVLRYGIPYGPRARGGAVIPIFVRRALNGEPITIQGKGSQYRKFLYVEDLAEGNVLALQSQAANRTYNLEGMEKVTIRQLAETVKELVGDVEIEYTEGRKADFSGQQISGERAREELGWKPQTGLQEGIRRYIEWYERREAERNDSWAEVDQLLRV